MQSKLIGFYCFILSKRDIISFLAGIIVSGYVVEISILQNLNKWHLLSIIAGILIGLFCLILVRISENFEDNTKAFKKNIPAKPIHEIRNDTWISINTSSSDSNKIFKLLPKFWLPLITLFIPSLLFLGVLFLKCANNEIQNKSLNESQIEKRKLVHQIDSITQIQTDNLIIKFQRLNDSNSILKNKIDIETKKIDSLFKIQSLDDESK